MATLQLALPSLFANEGGYSSSPLDPGGETKYGITKKQYPQLDIKNLTKDQAAQIYNKDYWRFDAITDQRVATKLLDMAVNMGLGTAIRTLQRILTIKVDGIFGPSTSDAVNKSDADELLVELRAASALRYALLVIGNPSLADFLAGWIHRACE